ncbi:Curli production assembly/transport component CsgG [Orenia metallireducens]|uniref:Curli production assembly/transport component CsgG n=1 Tax=Orenia metallireducens TaxID=1413210 RepID=A0A285FW46_9FIRM|nr:CsgG/HfaB family protein [Orenia metallireducens]PRX35654.1 Curli production assembly/transport component CsgG [Orenia metallireducens]SNY15475.1 Curli production assembly/transport component CsgG [Orenia metallireducens]
MRIISVILMIFMLVSFVGTDYARAQSISASSSGSDGTEKGIIGALVILGVFGIYKVIKNHREEQYQNHLSKGEMFLEKEEYGLAIKDLSQAKDIKDSAEVNKLLYNAKEEYKKCHYQLGSDYLAEGNWELAYNEFKKVKIYDNNYFDTNEKYNLAYQKLRELKLKRIGVIDFEDTTYRYNLGSRATSLFSAQLLNRDPKFIEIIERKQLKAILEEQQLGATGLIDSATAKEIGNILGVDYLVVGKVLSGNVNKDESSEYVETWDGEKKKRYHVQKQAYTKIIFKLLDVSDASIVLSKTVTKKSNYSEYYYRDESIIIPSDEEMIDRVLTNAVDEFAQDIYEKYEL